MNKDNFFIEDYKNNNLAVLAFLGDNQTFDTEGRGWFITKNFNKKSIIFKRVPNGLFSILKDDLKIPVFSDAHKIKTWYDEYEYIYLNIKELEKGVFVGTVPKLPEIQVRGCSIKDVEWEAYEATAKYDYKYIFISNIEGLK
jgi:hypothetical protein